jgi:hypothetical protein
MLNLFQHLGGLVVRCQVCKIKILKRVQDDFQLVVPKPTPYIYPKDPETSSG